MCRPLCAVPRLVSVVLAVSAVGTVAAQRRHTPALPCTSSSMRMPWKSFARGGGSTGWIRPIGRLTCAWPRCWGA